jgi:hypothetical protein
MLSLCQAESAEWFTWGLPYKLHRNTEVGTISERYEGIEDDSVIRTDQKVGEGSLWSFELKGYGCHGADGVILLK